MCYDLLRFRPCSEICGCGPCGCDCGLLHPQKPLTPFSLPLHCRLPQGKQSADSPRNSNQFGLYLYLRTISTQHSLVARRVSPPAPQYKTANCGLSWCGRCYLATLWSPPPPPYTTNKPPSHVYPRGLLPCLPSVGCAGWLAAGSRPPGNSLPGANSTIKQKKDLGKKKKLHTNHCLAVEKAQPSHAAI